MKEKILTRLEGAMRTIGRLEVENENLYKSYKFLKEKVVDSSTKAILPSQAEIDTQVQKYAFKAASDGSGGYYNGAALKHFKEGIDWILNKIKELNHEALINNFNRSSNQ